VVSRLSFAMLGRFTLSSAATLRSKGSVVGLSKRYVEGLTSSLRKLFHSCKKRDNGSGLVSSDDDEGEVAWCCSSSTSSEAAAVVVIVVERSRRIASEEVGCVRVVETVGIIAFESCDD